MRDGLAVESCGCHIDQPTGLRTWLCARHEAETTGIRPVALDQAGRQALVVDALAQYLAQARARFTRCDASTWTLLDAPEQHRYRCDAIRALRHYDLDARRAATVRAAERMAREEMPHVTWMGLTRAQRRRYWQLALAGIASYERQLEGVLGADPDVRTHLEGRTE